jgi:hypothetical protein
MKRDELREMDGVRGGESEGERYGKSFRLR